MNRSKIQICYFVIIISLFLSSCEGSTSTPLPNPEIINPKPISYSETEIKNMTNCWLSANNTGFNKWVGNTQCTALARLLTTAPGYGKDENEIGYGGSDYIESQEKKGVIFPKLVDYRNKIKPCDNLILIGSGFAAAGHTVVVFYPDLENEIVYYLDQNFSGQGVTLRQKKISDIENIAYVISAECKKPIDATCFSVTELLDSTPITVQSLDISSTQVSQVDGMEMLYIPAGSFLMGSPDWIGNDFEHPQNSIFLDGYWIDKTEVTNSMYEKCVSAGACRKRIYGLGSPSRELYYGSPDFENYPVINIDWDEANTYCQWAGRSLPSEAQWEKAARGKDGQAYPWGNQVPNSSLYNDTGDTTQVGSYPAGASPFGVLDMAGNVQEWVTDWFDPNYYTIIPKTNPIGQSGEDKVIRGGAASLNDPETLRTAIRGYLNESVGDFSLGFRCALSE